LAGAVVFAAAVRARSRQAKRVAGETLALAAHELKSPLAAIESYLDLMALGAPEDARGVRLWLEDVRRMKSTASHLRRTIGDILDMTDIEAGRLKLSPRRVPLEPLLTEVAEEYGALARAQGVSVVVEAPSGISDAMADPDRTRQVLHNLLSNALKFTPAGRGVHLSAEAEGTRLCIDVRDEGVGVPSAMRDKLFGKFSRLSPALNDKEGTGLGLYISRRLVEAQGGRLTYEPAPDGRGSRFRMTLPRAAAP
jgi:signal transduction histidine kinase